MSKPTLFLENIFNHILSISKGECDISDSMILDQDHENKRNILAGLRLLHEDIELYKSDLKKSMEADYQVKILREKNEELIQFNYVASHDMQEPLRTIRSFSELLENRYNDQLDQKGKEYLSFISESSKRLSQLINGLLNYSKIGLEQSYEEIDTNQLVEEIIRDLEFQINETQIVISLDDLPIIKADPLGIRQVFQNLITNAIKFRTKNGNPQVWVSCKSDKQGHIFEIKDNGLGIAPQFQNQIFNIFQRLHSKNEIEGTGIGLSLCKKVIELHKGKIWLESKLDRGSSFFFIIPQ